MSDIPFVAKASQQSYGRASVVTKSDTVANVFSALYIGATGDVTVTPQGQTTTVLFAAVPAGTTLPIAVSLVMATGTTSTNIVGLR